MPAPPNSGAQQCLSGLALPLTQSDPPHHGAEVPSKTGHQTGWPICPASPGEASLTLSFFWYTSWLFCMENHLLGKDRQTEVRTSEQQTSKKLKTIVKLMLLQCPQSENNQRIESNHPRYTGIYEGGGKGRSELGSSYCYLAFLEQNSVCTLAPVQAEVSGTYCTA